jgi:excisionase family DNA binding protein
VVLPAIEESTTMPRAKTPVWVTFKRLAEVMGVSERTVRRWAHQGRLPGLRKTPGGRWRFDLNRVDEILTETNDRASA